MTERTKIVVVDDDANILRIVSLFLEKKGFEVVTVSRGLEAVSIIEKEKPNLVLLDIFLEKNLSSEFIVHNIREHKELNGMPIIIVTSMTSECYREKFINELGCCDYVEKPFDSEDLMNKINNALNKA